MRQEVDCTGVGGPPPALPAPEPPVQRDRAQGERGLHPGAAPVPWDPLRAGSAQRGAPGRASPQSSPGAEDDPPCRARGSGCSWSYRQVWQKLTQRNDTLDEVRMRRGAMVFQLVRNTTAIWRNAARYCWFKMDLFISKLYTNLPPGYTPACSIPKGTSGCL